MIAQGGTVYEVVGHAGTGKTQLCLTAVAECLVAGGRVAYIDTKAGQGWIYAVDPWKTYF